MRMSVHIGLGGIGKEARRAAWMVMLGIRVDGDEVREYRELYHMFMKEQAVPGSA